MGARYKSQWTQFFALCFSRSQTPSLRKDFVGSVAKCILKAVHDGSGAFAAQKERSRLSGGACTWEPREGGHYEHVQALVTNMFQRHCEWKEDRWTD